MDKQISNLESLIKSDYGNIAGIIVLNDGKTRFEKYFSECTAASRIHVYSVTKSINQKVLDFFPDYTVNRREKTIQNVTIKDLLTMTAPYEYKFAPYTYIKYFMSDDWVKFTLDVLGGKGQIGKFRYTPLIGSDILSGILVQVTGQSVFELGGFTKYS